MFEVDYFNLEGDFTADCYAIPKSPMLPHFFKGRTNSGQAQA
jgi:hypothetical protein